MLTDQTAANLRHALQHQSPIWMTSDTLGPLLDRYEKTGGEAYDSLVTVAGKGGAVVPAFVADEVEQLRAKCVRLANELAEQRPIAPEGFDTKVTTKDPIEIVWFGFTDEDDGDDDDDDPEDDLIELLTAERDALIAKNNELAIIGLDLLQRLHATEVLLDRATTTLANLSTMVAR